MKWTPRIKRAGIGVFICAVLVAIGYAVEQVRPGTVMCALRRLAHAVNVTIPIPQLTPAEEAAARAEAAKWKVEMLERFPNLAINPHPVPAEENGFLQLYLLDGRWQPGGELAETLRDLGQADLVAAPQALEANAEWVEHVEWIASLTQRSSMDMPDDYVGYFNARAIKQAADTLFLKALLAAKSKDDPEALRCIAAAGNLVGHLQQVETPTLLTETVCVLIHLGKINLIMEDLLPAIGMNAALPKWHDQIERIDLSPSRLAVVYRGEWQVGADAMTFPLLAIHQRQGLLTDPKDVAAALSAQISHVVQTLRQHPPKDMRQALKNAPGFDDLSYEGRGIMGLFHMGAEPWFDGYTCFGRRHARVQAAMELLLIEPCQGDLSAEDTEHMTLDPLSGEPFDFDPDKRTLDYPDGFPTEGDEPLKLPW